ncbi:hypothetical protein FMEAI12_4370010 [Parafrankia sp. Ea1.12]|nr:hypothetical protein FMEAI12_4370010 [Parafrankia sp. Ea1.12]
MTVPLVVHRTSSLVRGRTERKNEDLTSERRSARARYKWIAQTAACRRPTRGTLGAECSDCARCGGVAGRIRPPPRWGGPGSGSDG